MDSKVFRDLSYGMFVISTKYNDRNVGCFVNTVTQITSKNPIIAVSVNKENYTNEAIKQTNKFAVSILSEKSSENTISKFGFFTSKDTNKFEEVDFEIIENIPVVKDNICGYMICEVIKHIDCETHDVFFARVIDGNKENDYVPMTYKFYHEVIKGKAPKKAPTYVEENTESDIKVEIEGEEVYICSVCGYIHKGSMPDDFKCPRCGVDKSLFERK